MNNILSNEPVISVMCNEGKEHIIRSVYPMEMSQENLLKFWEKARQFKTIYSKEYNDSFEQFLSLFISVNNNVILSNSLFWVVDDFIGIFYMTDIVDNDDAILHYTFFDKRHEGRHDLCVKFINFLFEKYQFHRLSAQIPLYATQYPFKFVEELGFRPEGRKRKCIPFNNEWFDLKLYGIFPQEVGVQFERKVNEK